MKFFMEKNKDESHRVIINIPKKTVKSAILKEFIKISKTTNINGFRKGKVPIAIVQKKYGRTVYYDVFKELMQKFFYEFLNKEKIKIIGSPQYYMHNSEENKKEYFEYSVNYEIYPKCEIKNIELIKVKKINVIITNEDINKILKKYSSTTDNWDQINKKIKSHDRVTINYEVYEKYKKLKKFSTKDVIFIVSENTLIPDLNHKVINHLVGDIIFFKINFHSFHPEKELQNKDITLKIKIIKIEKRRKSELNETLEEQKKINKLNYENIKNNINIQIKKINQQHFEQQIIEKIIKKNPISIPPILFQEEIKILYQQYQKEYQENKHNILEQKYHTNIELKAKKRLYVRIIIEKIISDNKLFADEKNIQLLIKEISLNYKKPLEIINLYNKNNNLKNTIRNIELERQAMFFLKKNVEIIKENWTLDEFMKYDYNRKELCI